MKSRGVVSFRRARVGGRVGGRGRLLTAGLFILPAFAQECPSDRLYVVGHLHRYEATGSGTMADRSERIGAIGRMGFGGTRLAFEWGLMEPERGTHTWDDQDRIIAELEAAGIGVYGMIGYSPDWARPADTRQTHRPIVDGSAAAGDTAFAAFAAAAARRYRGRVDRWEIWNEPNIRHFWAHLRDGRDLGPDPRDYGELFKLAADSIMAANPDAVISTAGLTPGPRRFGGRPSGYPADEYLDSLLSMGIRADAIGIHPYTRRPRWLNVSSGEKLKPSNIAIDRALAVMRKHELNETPLWITEWGVDLTTARGDADATTWFAIELRYLICHPRVELVTVYALQDRGAPRKYSLLRPDGSLSTSGRALATMLANWTDC